MAHNKLEREPRELTEMTERAISVMPLPRRRWAVGLRGRWPIVVYAIFVVAVYALLRESFLLDIFVSIGFAAIAAVGLHILFGLTGQLSLGQNGFMAIGAYVSGVLTVRLGLPVWLAFVCALLVNSLVAVLVGTSVARLKGFYLAIATLAFGTIVYAFVGAISPITGGGAGLWDIPPIAIGSKLERPEYYLLTWFVLGLLVVLAQNIAHSRIGRAMLASKDDSTAAECLGMKVAFHRVQAFMLAAGCASVAGTLMAHYIRYIVPEYFTLDLALNQLLIVLFGGAALAWGTVIGASFIVSLPYLLGVFADYKPIVYGVLFALVLIFMPNGILAALGNLARRLFGSGTETVHGNGAADGALRQMGEFPTFARRSLGANGSRPGTPLLMVQSLEKGFGGLKALNGVEMTVSEGSITALIGPNGAGKTTLLNVITGVARAGSGHISYLGRSITGLGADGIADLGIQRTFQTPRVFGEMNVLENVMAGRYCRTRTGLLSSALRLPGLRWEESQVRQEALELLRFVGLESVRYASAGSLPHGDQRLLELARALASQPRLLILDEPAAGLNEAETDLLKEILLTIRRFGITVLFVEHDMRLVTGVSDRVIALEFGTVIAEGSAQEVQSNERVIQAYLGDLSEVD